MDIYVGNLAYGASEDDIRKVFEEHGQVEFVRIITDRETGRSKGFGFVGMPEENEGDAAIEALDGNELGGRKIKVNKARPRNAGF